MRSKDIRYWGTDMNDVVSNIVRIGQVSSIDGGQVRVAYDDLDDMVSAPLSVVQRNTVNRQESSLPEVGEHVLVMHLPSGPQEGFVLGSYYTAGNQPSNGKPGVYRTEYSDGTVIEYDLNTNTARVCSQHSVEVEAKDITVKAETVTIEGRSVSIKAEEFSVRAEKLFSVQVTATDGTISLKADGPDASASMHGGGGASISSDNDSIGV
jgi:phage baseplate assembly protein V